MAPQIPGLGPCLPTASGRGAPFTGSSTLLPCATLPATTDIVAELRTNADSRRLPVVTNYRNILFDVLVHAQDIAIPLGRDYPMPPEAARAGADRVWTMGWPFWARRRLRGLRLLATDIDWSAGAGAELRGPIGNASAAIDSTDHDGGAAAARPRREDGHRALGNPAYRG